MDYIMAKKKPQNISDSLSDSILFSDQPAMTAQERQALAREQKRQKREEKREQNRQLRAALRERITPSTESRKATVILLALIGALVLFAIAVLVLQLGVGSGQEPKEGLTYYVNTGDLPEMDENGISASISEVYYTQNGGVQVYLTLANGKATPQHPIRIQVKIMNAEEEVIVAASHEEIPENFYVIDNGYESYQLYIPKKFVEISDDPLSGIMYDVIVDSVEYSEE